VALAAAGTTEAHNDASDELAVVHQHEVQALPRMIRQRSGDRHTTASKFNVHFLALM
jgi:hypothetical protein